MDKSKNFAERLSHIDFLQGADNVYRTQKYIVSQKITLMVNKYGDAYSVSNDNYYLRTPRRDADYLFAFQLREHIDGRRVHSSTYIRNYID